MKKTIRENKNRFYFFSMLFFSLTVVIIVLILVHQNKVKTNEATATKVLQSFSADKDLSLVSTKQLDYLLTLEHLSSSTKAKIYDQLAQITYLSDDKQKYSTNIASAVYYYKKCGNYNRMTRLYIEYTGRLSVNGDANTALSILDKLNENNAIDSYKNKDTVVNYYLRYGEIAEVLGKHNLAHKAANKALPLIESLESSSYYDLYAARYSLLKARYYLSKGDLVTSQDVLRNYQQHDRLSLPKGNQYVLYDFTMPYYEILAELTVERNLPKQSIRYIDSYLELCEKYKFDRLEYQMLKYALVHSKGMPAKKITEYQQKIIAVADSDLLRQSSKYGKALLSNITLTRQNLDLKHSTEGNNHSFWDSVIIIIYASLLLVWVWDFILLDIRTDHLTRLGTRSAYEHCRWSREKFKKSHTLLILDVDSFQKINVAYGYAFGDQVLAKVGEIIRDKLPLHCHAFRYGADEFCILLPFEDLAICELAANTLRLEIAGQKWTLNSQPLSIQITVSGGMAKSNTGKNVFPEADRNLYRAKEQGKNQIQVYENILAK